MAWLYATPESGDKGLASKESQRRIDAYKDNLLAVPLPPCSMPWLYDYLWEIGPSVPMGMGMAPVGWRDIVAWQEATGNDLQPWQAKLIRNMSAAYVVECEKAKKPDAVQPWMDGDHIEGKREDVSRRIGNAFKSFLMAKG